MYLSYWLLTQLYASYLYYHDDDSRYIKNIKFQNIMETMSYHN